MTPEQKIKYLILVRRAELADESSPVLTAETVDKVYEEAELNDDGSLQDARSEVRSSGEETGLPVRFSSRHYESDEVAAQALDGSWVGWTYWHGGGKYGEPEAVDWIKDAYDVACAEEQKIVTVRTFTTK
ncbi:hypothetical protein [Achromobacter xylosoxidans]|uniref:hypothetical protein n=1 Tax=Alcaligenes xylosoxydans xylosoxydans TaxID=85698 RepID=UPI001EEEB691|nr:hypothetical protein [Achromobacter xylosoxidans]